MNPELFSDLAQQLPDGIIVTDTQGRILWVNTAVCSWLACTREQLTQKHFDDLMPSEELLKLVGLVAFIAGRDSVRELHLFLCGPSETRASVVANISRLRCNDGLERVVVVAREAGANKEAMAESTRRQLQREVAQRLLALDAMVAARTDEAHAANEELQQRLLDLQRMELDLRLAQKLEGIGRLAAGVAHEINTPVQFIADNLDFLREAYGEVRQELQRATSPGDQASASAEIADLEYLDVEVPRAFTSVAHGVTRIAKIVGAMKSFAHDGHGEYVNYDVNQGLQTTLEIARGEFKDIADLQLDLGELPTISCKGDEINQAFLNLIVNASHAIQDVVGTGGKKGKIGVATRAESGSVVVSIQDTGTGIPEEVRAKMFDLFFTTKPVGRGTGQGLSLVWKVVVVDHGGQVWVDTELGAGSTFHLRLPLKAAKAA